MTTWHKLIWGLFGLIVLIFLLVPAFLREAPTQFSTNLKEELAPAGDLTDLSLFEILNDRLMAGIAKGYNLISPSSRLIYFPAGLRKEEITDRLAQNLDLTDSDIKTINKPITIANQKFSDGYIRPGFYLFNPPFSGEKIVAIFKKRFSDEVLKRYPKQTNEVVDLKKSIIIASLIEREASGSHDMPLISGVIWNRLEIKMPLGLDASLQYIYGTSSNWWPKVLQTDKKSPSPFNTYKYSGLPPEPISNPSDQSIMSALNPVKTECLFYLHDRNRKIHCTETYEEHKEVIKKYY